MKNETLSFFKKGEKENLMGLFEKLKKPKNVEERSKSDFSYGGFSITSFFGDGEEVTKAQALKIPTVAQAVELISGSIAQLPIYLYKEEENGEIIKVSDKRVFLLNDEPNDLMNGYNFKKQIIQDYLFYGASYTVVEKVRNEVMALYNLPIEDVSITKYKYNGYKYSAKVKLVYDPLDTSGNSEFSTDELIIVLRDSDDGVTSSGILKNNSDILKLAIDELDYSSSILNNGALPTGVLSTSSKLTQPALERLKIAWQNLYIGAKKSGKTIILEEGLEYKPISMKPNELDLTNSKKSTIAELSRIFNLPQSMIDSTANKYASNEQNNIYLLQYCFSPIICALETAINKSLLLENEKFDNYFFRVDTSEILRTTESEKIKTTIEAMKNGLFSTNEARARHDLHNFEKDYVCWSLGNIFYDVKTGDMIIPNMGQVIDPDNPQSIPTNQNESASKENETPIKDEELEKELKKEG